MEHWLGFCWSPAGDGGDKIQSIFIPDQINEGIICFLFPVSLPRPPLIWEPPLSALTSLFNGNKDECEAHIINRVTVFRTDHSDHWTSGVSDLTVHSAVSWSSGLVSDTNNMKHICYDVTPDKSTLLSCFHLIHSVIQKNSQWTILAWLYVKFCPPGIRADTVRLVLQSPDISTAAGKKPLTNSQKPQMPQIMSLQGWKVKNAVRLYDFDHFVSDRSLGGNKDAGFYLWPNVVHHQCLHLLPKVFLNFNFHSFFL